MTLRINLHALQQAAESKPPGYLADVLAHGELKESTLYLSARDYAALREKYASSVSAARQIPPKQAQPGVGTKPTGGAGTELKAMLKKIGIVPAPNCKCNARAAMMDSNGVEWCEANVETLVGWLREEAVRRKILFVEIAARLVVKQAIRRARARQQRTPRAPTA